MLVLKIIGCLVVLLGLPYGSFRLLRAFNQRCASLFGYSVITVPKVMLMGFACVLFYGGSAWSGIAEHIGIAGSAPVNGAVLIALAAMITLWLAYQNYRQTNWLFGTAATMAYIGLAPVAVQVGIIFAFFALAVFAVVAMTARPVYVVKVF